MKGNGQWWRTDRLILSAPNNMTKEERKEWYHDWYWNRGGREQTLQRRRERGPLKWGTKLNNGNQ